MSNPTGQRGDAPLDKATLYSLTSAWTENRWESQAQAAEDLNVGVGALARALAGLPVRDSTRKLIAQGLERLDAAKVKPPEDFAPAGLRSGKTSRPTAVFGPPAPTLEAALCGGKPVCPRCLDIEPGIPGGTPDQPHPGPFTDRLRDPCSLVCEAALRAEGRTEAADFEASQRAQRSR